MNKTVEFAPGTKKHDGKNYLKNDVTKLMRAFRCDPRRCQRKRRIRKLIPRRTRDHRFRVLVYLIHLKNEIRRNRKKKECGTPLFDTDDNEIYFHHSQGVRALISVLKDVIQSDIRRM